ncbi:palmitoyltransferase ZDHHC3 isoform X1 [Sigmodon hispidus]
MSWATGCLVPAHQQTSAFGGKGLGGIERLQQKKQPREHSGSWKSVQEAFGGDFSLNWFNPFTRPCQPEIPIDKGLVRQVSSLSDMDNMETTESQLEETKDGDSVEVLDE